MNVNAKFINQNVWVDKRLMKISPIAAKAMTGAMSEVKGKAQYKYLRGPYPYRLSFHTKGRTGSALKNNLQIVVLEHLGDIYGIIGIPELVKYGKYWEAIDEYKHRRGMAFKGGHPMARPFVEPAWEEMEWEAKRHFKAMLAGGLSD